MSGREWKPGDVALVRMAHVADGRADRGSEAVAIRDNVDVAWACGAAIGHRLTDDNVLSIRPLVVIDPEDRDQVERLLLSLLDSFGRDLSSEVDNEGRDVRSAQAALRAMTQPPRPPEPTGLGAVVEDEDTTLWVRTAIRARKDHAAWRRAAHFNQENLTKYADIKVATVHSTGWSE